MSGYNIAIVSTGLPFNGNSLSTGSLGGSETGIVYLAREFVKAGHTVSVFSSCGPQAEGVFDGVIYFDISKWEPLGTFLNLDVLIVNRASQYLSQKCKAKAIYFYCQDATPENDQVHNQLWQTDRVVLLSPYHREIWESVEPRYGDHILEARNGVDLELIDKARKSVCKRSAVDDSKVNFIYASRPERGLKPLLEMWPLILQRIPKAFLTITTYNSQAIQVPENIQNIANWCYQTASQYPDSIKVLAKGLKKFDLYRLYLGCKALLYPCSFPEVSCGVGSTKVRIPGGCVEFKDVKAGDLVYGFDEKTKLISLGKVKWSRRTRKRAEVWKLSYGWKGGCQGAREDFVRFTPDHKFLMLDGTWTELKDLKPGDRLQPFYYQVISVVFDGYEDVYDMEVEGTHNFVANHIIAHNCISAIEAMATDTLVITTENYALVDTVAQDNGVLIPGRPQEEEYRTRFLSAVEKSVRTLEYQPRITRARAKIEGSYSWKSAAKIWLDDFNQLFQNRVTNKASGIIQTLYKNEDLVATREMTSQLKMGDQEQWAQIVLDRAIIADKLLINSPHHFPGKTSKGMAIRSVVSSFLSQHPEADTLLDLETGIGDTAAFLTKAFPQLSVTGLSIHAAHLQDAERTYFNDKDSPLLADDQARLTFAQSSSQTSADIVLAEKVLEYELDLTQCVKNIEDRVKNGGLCVVITREGPWSSDLEQLDVGYKSGRLHNFDGQDLTELLGHKQGFGSQCVVACHNNRGEVLSYWISYWVKSANSTVGEIDYSRKALTTRPYQGISLCMIVRDNEDHISQCLKSVLDVVDEFVIVNTGSTDTTMDIVRRLIPEERLVESSYAWDDDFSAARNYALSLCSQDWVLWLDSDEFLSGQKNLRKYLNSKIFPGFIIHQHHLTMDTELSPDTPVRLFKRGGIQWYGVVHEQVEQEMDASVRPSLLLKDVNVVHLGYAIEEVRRDKYFNRNMALMYKDRKQNPDRRLGKMLLARDYRNLVNYRLEGLLKTGGGVTPETILLMREVCSIHHNNFLDHKDPLYETSFKLYQEILRIMIELNIPIKEGIEGSGIKTVSFPYKDLEGQTRVRKVYFLTGDEYFAYCGRLLRESNS